MAATKNPSWHPPKLRPSHFRFKKRGAPMSPTAPGPSKSQGPTNPALPLAGSPGLSRRPSSFRFIPPRGVWATLAQCSTE
jgi:hypothetical protein